MKAVSIPRDNPLNFPTKIEGITFTNINWGIIPQTNRELGWRREQIYQTFRLKKRKKKKKKNIAQIILQYIFFAS